MATPPGGNLGSTKVAFDLVVGNDDDAPFLPVLRLGGSDSVDLGGEVVLAGTEAEEAGDASDDSKGLSN